MKLSVLGISVSGRREYGSDPESILWRATYSHGLTILAAQAIPVEELDSAKLDAQIQDAEEDMKDAGTDEGKRVAAEKLAQLREVRAVLNL